MKSFTYFRLDDVTQRESMDVNCVASVAAE